MPRKFKVKDLIGTGLGQLAYESNHQTLTQAAFDAEVYRIQEHMFGPEAATLAQIPTAPVSPFMTLSFVGPPTNAQEAADWYMAEWECTGIDGLLVIAEEFLTEAEKKSPPV